MCSRTTHVDPPLTDDALPLAETAAEPEGEAVKHEESLLALTVIYGITKVNSRCPSHGEAGFLLTAPLHASSPFASNKENIA